MTRRTPPGLVLIFGLLALVGVTAYGVHHVVARANAAAVAGVPASDAIAPVSTPNLESLERAIRDHTAITVAGIGSSVGVGAELQEASVQSPVGRLAFLLRARYPREEVKVHNLSVNGSTAFDGLQVYSSQVRRLHPTVLLIAFGMNDGQTAQFNSGETLPGSIRALREVIETARADGTTVLVATTPSPDTEGNDFTLPSGLPVIYPTPDGALVPSADDSVTMIGGQPFSARHAIWNREVRKLVKNERATLLDAGRYWPEAVGEYGEHRLFNVQHGEADPGRFVHPDLLGHQASYWRAESAFIDLLPRVAD